MSIRFTTRLLHIHFFSHFLPVSFFIFTVPSSIFVPLLSCYSLSFCSLLYLYLLMNPIFHLLIGQFSPTIGSIFTYYGAHFHLLMDQFPTNNRSIFVYSLHLFCSLSGLSCFYPFCHYLSFLVNFHLGNI